MAVSIIIQRREDWPGNPGWWRYSRPVHRIVAQPPEIREETRWWYGDADEAASAAAEWDAAHPRG